MVKVKVNDTEFYMDGYLKSNLDLARDAIRKDLDMVFIYDGAEGGGKSVKAMQDCLYMDPTFNLSRITFSPKEFKDAIYNATKYQAVMYDEAYFGLSARGSMSYINQALVSMLTQIRQKNLFVGIVLPTFFDLDKYVALWRSRALIHIYFVGNFERGFFMFFNIESKKRLYIEGKKTYSYSYPRADFTGRFTNTYVVDQEEYRSKKLASLVIKRDTQNKRELNQEMRSQLFKRIVMLKNHGDIETTHEELAKIAGVSVPTYYKYWKLVQQCIELDGDDIKNVREKSDKSKNDVTNKMIFDDTTEAT